jgi:hypothetical protein
MFASSCMILETPILSSLNAFFAMYKARPILVLNSTKILCLTLFLILTLIGPAVRTLANPPRDFLSFLEITSFHGHLAGNRRSLARARRLNTMQLPIASPSHVGSTNSFRNSTIHRPGPCTCPPTPFSINL